MFADAKFCPPKFLKFTSNLWRSVGGCQHSTARNKVSGCTVRVISNRLAHSALKITLNSLQTRKHIFGSVSASIVRIDILKVFCVAARLLDDQINYLPIKEIVYE